jgi:DNA-binding response OmpR family regulator
MAKILLVEDDPFIAEIYKKKLETSGFEVTNITSGKAVLKELQGQSFDLVLLDLVLPEMSGTEVLRELRHNKEYDPNIKIVVFSNLSSAEDREETLKLGANGFISKTEFSPSEVVGEIERFLRQFKEQAKNAVQGTEEENIRNGSGKKLLLIEDEPVFVEMFGKRLKNEGYEVRIEKDGALGLDAALKENFDLIITDVMMPNMDGREFISRLKETEAGKNVPIFLLSASVSIEDESVRVLTDAGIVTKAFLKTEITPSELTYAVNDYFQAAKDRK